jgi:hypothetical protein
MEATPQERLPDVVTGCLEACRRRGAVLAARAAGAEIPKNLAVAYSTERDREPLAMNL